MEHPLELEPHLDSGSQRIVKAVVQMAGGATPGLYHWLLALLSQHADLTEALTPYLRAQSLALELQGKLGQGRTGAIVSVSVMEHRAYRQALSEGRAVAAVQDLAAAILTSAGYQLQAITLSEPSGTSATSGLETLKRLGRCLTAEAAEYRLTPIVGRSEELQLALETLCRQTKRNPVFIGPAGCGKTAIVEGLAQRIASGDCPAALRSAQVWAIDPSSVLAVAHHQSDFHKLVQQLIAEASRPNIILFIDEVHQLIGLGGAAGQSDLSSLLKPALARGELACIAATTDEEYRKFIEPDAALERRFQPIRVQALTAAQTLPVLVERSALICRGASIKVAPQVLQHLLDLADHHMRNRQFPDKAIDLLEQSIAHVLALNRTEVTDRDVVEVLQRMVGMPLGLEAGLGSLRLTLQTENILTHEATASLMHRLKISLSGLDMRPERPNATLLLTGECAHRASRVAEVIAENLFGAADRVVTLDFGRMVEPQDITLLLGAPPGYVGYSETLTIHRLAQMPWCVLYCQNIDSCHYTVRDVLVRAIKCGFLIDARGKKLYLSDTVLLLTAESIGTTPQSIGLLGRNSDKEKHGPRQIIANALGEDFAAQMDDVFCDVPVLEPETNKGAVERMLQDVSQRCTMYGITLTWDSTFITWITDLQRVAVQQRDWERAIEDSLAAILSPFIDIQTDCRLKITCENGTPLAVQLP